jgi:hypothetical protein
MLTESRSSSKDYVLFEIETALYDLEQTEVLPVLLNNTSMPAPEVLPDSIRSLQSINALRVTDDSFDQNIEELCLFVKRNRFIHVDEQGEVSEHDLDHIKDHVMRSKADQRASFILIDDHLNWLQRVINNHQSPLEHKDIATNKKKYRELKGQVIVEATQELFTSLSAQWSLSHQLLTEVFLNILRRFGDTGMEPPGNVKLSAYVFRGSEQISFSFKMPYDEVEQLCDEHQLNLQAWRTHTLASLSYDQLCRYVIHEMLLDRTNQPLRDLLNDHPEYYFLSRWYISYS